LSSWAQQFDGGTQASVYAVGDEAKHRGVGVGVGVGVVDPIDSD
jgi:hypothetical protein